MNLRKQMIVSFMYTEPPFREFNGPCIKEWKRKTLNLYVTVGPETNDEAFQLRLLRGFGFFCLFIVAIFSFTINENGAPQKGKMRSYS